MYTVNTVAGSNNNNNSVIITVVVKPELIPVHLNLNTGQPRLVLGAIYR